MSVSGNQHHKLARIGFTNRQIRTIEQDQAEYITITYDALSHEDRHRFRTLLGNLDAASDFLSTRYITKPEKQPKGHWVARKYAGKPGSLLLNASPCGAAHT